MASQTSAITIHNRIGSSQRAPTRLVRLLSLGLAGMLVLAACGSAEEAVDDTPEPPAVTAPTPEPEPEPAPEPAEESPEPAPAGDAELVWSINFTEERRQTVNAIVAHPDGETLLVGTNATYLIQAADGYLLDAIVYWYPSVDDLGVSPDGNLVGAGVSLGGVPLSTLDGEIPDGFEGLDQHRDFAGARFHGGYDNNLSFSPDGVHLATGNRSGAVWIYNLDTVEQVATLTVDDPDYLSFLAYHPSGDLLAAIDFTCRVDFWDVTSGQIVHNIELDFSSCYWTRPLAFSPDGALVATAIREDRVEFVRIWTVDGFEPVRDLDMDVRNFGELAFSPDSSMLATASWRLPPTVWDVNTGDILYSLDSGIDPDDGDGWYHPRSIAFTPDGGHVAVGYSEGTLELWRLPGAQPLVAPEREVCEPLPLPGDVLFDTGSAQLRSEADPALTELAEQVAAGFDQATLTFVGHTDSRGDATANQQLSLARAEAVRDWFAQWASDSGITGWTLEVEGRGEAELKVTDVDSNGAFIASAGAINRRVEIEIDAEGCL